MSIFLYGFSGLVFLYIFTSQSRLVIRSMMAIGLQLKQTAGVPHASHLLLIMSR